jgi:hypothetical protein
MSNRTLLPPSEPQPPTGGDKPPPASPPYTLDRKLIIGAAIVEATVIGAGTLSAVAFALRSAHDSIELMQALAPQLAFVAIEGARIPLAIKCRVNPSRFARVLAVAGLMGGAGITTKTMIQAVDAMYEPRFAAVRHAEYALEDAKENQANVNAAFQAATADVERAKSLVEQNIARVRDASGDLRGLPRVCDSKGHCHADTRAKLIGGNLREATGAVATAKKDLDAANGRLKLLDPSKPSQALRAAELAYHDALSASFFHQLASQLTGKPVTQISESAMSTMMRFFILGASILTALTASIMAMCAVTPVKPKTVRLPDRALLRLLDPMRQEIVQAAAIKTTDEVKRLFAQEAEAEAEAKRQAADAATLKAFQKIVEADTTAARLPAKPEPRKLAPRRSAKKAAASRVASNDAGNVIPLKGKDSLS